MRLNCYSLVVTASAALGSTAAFSIPTVPRDPHKNCIVTPQSTADVFTVLKSRSIGNPEFVVHSRKDALTRLFRRMSISCTVGMAFFGRMGGAVHAACLSGDTSTSCIGVYKMPIDDEVLPFVDTPEKLRLYAPDLQWVPPVPYPKNVKDALMELRSEREACRHLVPSLVWKGELEHAGVELLRIVPRVTVCGKMLIRALHSEASKRGDSTTHDDRATRPPEKSGISNNGEAVSFSMKAYRVEVAYTDLLANLGQCDVLIGQAIGGQLGSLTPAQIQILSLLDDVNSEFSNLMAIVPIDLFE